MVENRHAPDGRVCHGSGSGIGKVRLRLRNASKADHTQWIELCQSRCVNVMSSHASRGISSDARELTYQGYSAYAPQLATKLAISSTQVNLVGVAGNLGMYAMGPIWGSLIDARGQRLYVYCLPSE